MTMPETSVTLDWSAAQAALVTAVYVGVIVGLAAICRYLSGRWPW